MTMKPQYTKKPEYYIGLDLGQMSDYTALCVLKREESWQADHKHVLGGRYVFEEYQVQHLERFKIGTPYPEISRRVKLLQESDQLLEAAVRVVVDATGVGRPVVDMLDEDGVKHIAAVTITGGNVVSRVSPGEWHVPKRDLVSTLQVLYQTGKVRIAAGLPDAAVLRSELVNFKAKINIATGHDTYEAWREGDHDDLVLSLALAAWYAESGTPIPDYTRVF